MSFDPCSDVVDPGQRPVFPVSAPVQAADPFEPDVKDPGQRPRFTDPPRPQAPPPRTVDLPPIDGDPDQLTRKLLLLAQPGDPERDAKTAAQLERKMAERIDNAQTQT